MIKAAELRIGNVARVANLTGFVEVVFFDGDTDDYVEMSFSPNYKYILHDLDPVPITIEWLERMAFIKDRSGWHMPGTQFSLTEQFFPCWLDRMLWPQDIQDFHQTSLNYVHQLQNLYFALTGQELPIAPLAK